jgi:phage-related minor tail protein
MILFMKPGTGKEVNIDRLKTIASADITIMLIFAAVIMLFYTLGMTQDPKFTSLSLMLSLVAILSASLITMKKSSSEFLRAVDSNGRVIQLEVPMTTITDEVTKKKTEIPVGISTSLGGVGQFIGDSLGFLLKLLPAIIAIMLVGSIVPGILMSFGILPKDISALISGGGIMFATVGLIAFKLIEKVEKLKRGEEV